MPSKIDHHRMASGPQWAGPMKGGATCPGSHQTRHSGAAAVGTPRSLEGDEHSDSFGLAVKEIEE